MDTVRSGLSVAVVLAVLAWGALALRRGEPPLQRQHDIEAPALQLVVHNDSPATDKQSANGDASTHADVKSSGPRDLGSPASPSGPDDDNYLVLAHALLPRAQAGDPAAQFRLFEVLEYCRSYSAFFGPPAKRLTYDEAVARTVRLNGDPAELRTVYERCAAFVETDGQDFGEAEEWLRRASELGHDNAQVAWADRLIVSGLVKQNEQNRHLGKQLLLEQLAKQNPAAIFSAGSLQAVLTGDFERAMKDQFVWFLAACDAGHDCSETSAFYRYACRYDHNCQPGETVRDVILRVAAEHNDLEMLAEQLLEKIRRRELDDLNWR
jgi:TPR repeat protein